jgi:hypothetical protein
VRLAGQGSPGRIAHYQVGFPCVTAYVFLPIAVLVAENWKGQDRSGSFSTLPTSLNVPHKPLIFKP